MKIRFLVIATALALASTPGLADWAKAEGGRLPARYRGERYQQGGVEGDHRFLKETWESVSSWGPRPTTNEGPGRQRARPPAGG